MWHEIGRIQDAVQKAPILVVADGPRGLARLLTLDNVTGLYLVAECEPVVSVGMPVLLHKFQRLVVNEGITSSSFTAQQLATISGTPYDTVHTWFEAGILVADGEGSTAKERRSSFSTAFGAGLAGALRRKGISLPAIKRACDLIRAIGKPESATAAEPVTA